MWQGFRLRLAKGQGVEFWVAGTGFEGYGLIEALSQRKPYLRYEAHPPPCNRHNEG